MGCDIHVTVETRKDGVWSPAMDWSDKYECGELVPTKEVLGQRNYAFFGLLSGVRRPMEGITPLATPGIPKDASKAVKKFHNGNHTPGSFTVADVLAWDWLRPQTYEGHVDAKEFARFIVNGQPQSYSGGVGGGGVTHISNDEMKALIEACIPVRRGDQVGAGKHFPFHDLMHTHDRPALLDFQAKAHAWLLTNGKKPDYQHVGITMSPYTHVTWQRPLYEAAQELFADALPQLLPLGPHADVRVVVSYDN